MRGTHVLFVPSWYPTAGHPINGIFFQDQARCLAAGGYEVGVLAAETRRWKGSGIRSLLSGLGQNTDEEDAGLHVIRGQVLNVRPRRWRAARWIRLTLRLAERYRARYGVPDLIHAQSMLWGGYAALILAREWRRPLVVTEHSSAFLRNLLTPWERSWIRSASAAPTQVLAVAPALAAAVAAVTATPAPRVVPNLVDTEFFLPANRQVPQSTDVLCVAVLMKNKAIDVLLAALARLKEERVHVRLRVVGDGPERSALEAQSANLGLLKQVTFTGSASREEVRAAMWQSRVFVLPSHVETFGLVLAEAMACGLPVVATRSGGPESFVRPPFGWLTPVGDVGALAAAVLHALQADGTGTADARHQFACAEFGPAAFRNRMAEIYATARPHAGG